MKLTIGIPVYDDPSGLEWTLQGLVMDHDLTDVEILVVDNHPVNDAAGKESKATRELRSYVQGLGGRYIPLPWPVGTAPPRDRIFAEATGDVVYVLDSHVKPSQSTLPALREYFSQPAHRNDLVSGPILLKSLQPGTTKLAPFGTHYARVFRSNMEGIWAEAWRCPCGSDWHFDVHYDPPDFAPWFAGQRLVTRPVPPLARQCVYHTVSMDRRRVTACQDCGCVLPDLEYAKHQLALASLGYVRRCWASDPDRTPFEIPGMGLGAFACWRENWPGFAGGMMGFGGGELHLAEMFRRANGHAVCHPDCGWWHRFARDLRLDPDEKLSDAELLAKAKRRTPYSAPTWWIVRNYVLWRKRLNWPVDDVREHFVDRDDAPFNEAQWEHLIADPEAAVEYPQHLENPQQDPIVSFWREAMRSKNPATPLLPAVRLFASRSQQVIVLGKRWQWDAAVLSAKPAEYTSHNTGLTEAHRQRLTGLGQFAFDAGDSLAIAPATNDLLLIDSVHTADRLRLELQRWSPHCLRWIAVYGTGAYGEVVEQGTGDGLMVAIREFLDQSPDWRLVFEDPSGSGLSVISCDRTERPIDCGPGSQLGKIFRVMKVVMPANCSCREWIRKMDAWGVAGTREHADEIASHLRSSQAQFGWGVKIAAAAQVLRTGLWLKINWADPFPGLIEEAARRAEIFERHWPADASTPRSEPCT